MGAADALEALGTHNPRSSCWPRLKCASLPKVINLKVLSWAKRGYSHGSSAEKSCCKSNPDFMKRKPFVSSQNDYFPVLCQKMSVFCNTMNQRSSRIWKNFITFALHWAIMDVDCHSFFIFSQELAWRLSLHPFLSFLKKNRNILNRNWRIHSQRCFHSKVFKTAVKFAKKVKWGLSGNLTCR